MSYTVVRGETALGTEYRFKGPGLSQYACSVHFLQVPCDWALECLAKEKDDGRGQHEADVILGLLNQAFEAGKKAAKQEIRDVLGVHRHWGSRED